MARQQKRSMSVGVDNKCAEQPHVADQRNRGDFVASQSQKRRTDL